MLCLLLEKDVCNTTLNIGSGVGASINDIIQVLRDVVSEEVQVEYQPARKVDVAHMILDNSKLRKYVDVEFTPLKKGIALFYREIKGLTQTKF